MAAPTWKAVADALGARLKHHAYCEDHPESQPQPDCPFCKDRTAYRMWQGKAGVRDAPPEGRSMSLRELREWEAERWR